jgi:hypothetical protein
MVHAATSVTLSLFVAPPVAHAASLDEPSAKALAETLDSLASLGRPDLDPRLADIEDSPALTREFHEVAGAILTDLAERYDGDPERMNAALAQAKGDPAALAATLSPGTLARLAALAGKLPTKPH